MCSKFHADDLKTMRGVGDTNFQQTNHPTITVCWLQCTPPNQVSADSSLPRPITGCWLQFTPPHNRLLTPVYPAQPSACWLQFTPPNQVSADSSLPHPTKCLLTPVYLSADTSLPHPTKCLLTPVYPAQQSVCWFQFTPPHNFISWGIINSRPIQLEITNNIYLQHDDYTDITSWVFLMSTRHIYSPLVSMNKSNIKV